MSVESGQCGSLYHVAKAPSETKQAETKQVDEILIRATPDSVSEAETSADGIAFRRNLSSCSQPHQRSADSDPQVWPLSYWWFVALMMVFFCCLPLRMFGATSASVAGLSLSPTSKSFGYVAIGTTVTQAITLKSTGTAAVTIKYASVHVPGYTLLYHAFPFTLQPGQQTTLSVQFDPVFVGVAQGQLIVSSTSSTNPKAAVGLWGKGRPKSAVLSSLACASASESGAGTDACTVTLSGGAPSGGMAVSLSSSNAAVTVPGTVTVPANTTSASFTAMVSAVSAARTVVLTASAGGVSKTFGIQLNPAAPVSVTLNPLSVSLRAAQTQAFTATVANATNTAVTWSLSAAVGSLSAAGVYTAPASITSAQTVIVTATSVANPAVSAHATVSLAPAVSVTLNPTSVTLMPSQTQAFTATVANATNTAVTWSLSAAVGSLSAAGVYTAPASITSTQTINVTAISVANPSVSAYAIVRLNPSVATLNISASSMPFGNVVVNTTSTQAVTLTSTGNAPVTVTAAKAAGAGFTESGGTFPITLNPTQSVTLNVLFDPTVTGAVSGQLTITSNSSTNGAAAIALSGTGVAASYSVDLSWTAPTSSPDPVAGYKIYRAPSGSSAYALLNSASDITTTYVDSTVLGGLTYDYIVNSVDASGVESIPSNMIAVVIP